MEEFLIVGGGAVGLGCALFLHHHGRKCRILEKKLERMEQSKALAINAKTLELFQPLGISDKLIKQGHILKGIHFSIGKKELKASFTEISSEFPYTLILPQSKTEEIFEKSLQERGCVIERGVECIAFTEKEGFYEVLVRGPSNKEERIQTKYLIGADGIHSKIRELAGIPFLGKDYAIDIRMGDYLIEGSLDRNSAHYIVDETNHSTILLCIQENLFRIITNHKTIEKALPPGITLKEEKWFSSFHIHCKHAKAFSQGNLFLMGDAAHVHSPIGGRGMNLGLEDAHDFVHLYMEGKLSSYSSLRKVRSLQVLKETDRATHLLLEDSFFVKFFKFHLFPYLFNIKAIQRKFLAKNMGVG
jgi:2-polyprenyl-6-methoxyphenol hydroxylase-like FAD-dependent oxidoreductase